MNIGCSPLILGLILILGLGFLAVGPPTMVEPVGPNPVEVTAPTPAP